MKILLKKQAIETLKTLNNVPPEDVTNIIETIQDCYLSDEMTDEERFLVGELRSFINGIKS